MKTIYFIYLLTIVSSFLLLSCDFPYKAGNLVDLGFPVETRLRSRIIRSYMDTLIETKGMRVPTKWSGFDKLVDLDSVYHKRIYFKEGPEEMYLISTGGMVVLSDVLNPSIVQNAWIAEEASMPKGEKERVLKRFESEVLQVIEGLAKKDGLPDSMIYKY